MFECDREDLLRDDEPEPPDAERHRLNRERALLAAERALGRDRGGAVFDAAKLIYDLIVEREAALGRPIAETDKEFWALVEIMVRRWDSRLGPVPPARLYEPGGRKGPPGFAVSRRPLTGRRSRRAGSAAHVPHRA